MTHSNRDNDKHGGLVNEVRLSTKYGTRALLGGAALLQSLAGARIATAEEPAPAEHAVEEHAAPSKNFGGAPEKSLFSFETAEADKQGGAGASIVPMFQGLGLCLAIFFIGLHLYKRFHKHTEQSVSRRLRLIERIPLSGKSTLVLALRDGKPILLTVGSERVSLLQVDDQQLLSTSLESLCGEEQAVV